MVEVCATGWCDSPEDCIWGCDVVEGRDDTPSPPTARGELLSEAAAVVTGDRNNAYGPPDQDFSRTAEMLNALGFRVRAGDGSTRLMLPEDVARVLMCVKLSRSMWSNRRDHWLDMAGYAACGWECIELREEGRDE